MFTDINYLAIIVAGVVYFILGGLWYAAIFSKQYQAALNFSESEQQQAQKDFPKALLTHLISGLLASFVLANMIQAFGAISFTEGIMTGFWAWLGFVFTTNINSKMFERQPAALFMINAGFYLVALAVMGGILAVWV